LGTYDYRASSIALDSSGNVFVTQNGDNASILKLDANLSILMASNSISATGIGSIALDISGNVYLTGVANQDIFIAKCNGDLLQDNTVCTFVLSLISESFTSNGGTGNVSVTAQSSCTWTATSNDSWITITTGSNGTGNGTVNYSVSANTLTSQRTGSITIAGETFTVIQQGIICSFSIYPDSQSFDSTGGTGSVNITTQNGCSWTATSNDSWISITYGNNGTGNGTVNYSVSANTGSERIGTMTIAEQTLTVTQERIQTSECSAWDDVISKYQAYVIGQADWSEVTDCYNQYAS
jgi:hypothetical protein